MLLAQAAPVGQQPAPQGQPRQQAPVQPVGNPPQQQGTKPGTQVGDGKPGSKDDSTKAGQNSPEPGKRFQLQFLFGAGYGRIQPGILSESGTAWTLNSAVKSGSDGSSQAAVQVL